MPEHKTPMGAPDAPPVGEEKKMHSCDQCFVPVLDIPVRVALPTLCTAGLESPDTFDLGSTPRPAQTAPST